MSPNAASSSAAASSARPSGRRRDRSAWAKRARARARRDARRAGAGVPEGPGSDGHSVTSRVCWSRVGGANSRPGPSGSDPLIGRVEGRPQPTVAGSSRPPTSTWYRPVGQVLGGDRPPVLPPEVGQTRRTHPGWPTRPPTSPVRTARRPGGPVPLPTASGRGPARRSDTRRRRGPSATARSTAGRPMKSMSVVSLQVNRRPASTGLWSGRQVGAEGPIPLVQPQRVDGVVAGVGERKVGAGLDQRLVDAHGELARHVQLPAQLPHVGDPGGPDGRVTQVDLPAGAERERARRTGPHGSRAAAGPGTRVP